MYICNIQLKSNNMKQSILLIQLLAILMVYTGCQKTKIRGCKTAYAVNYKSNAEEDDGSCRYDAKLIIWQGSATASEWVSLGVTTLKFYVYGQFIGSCAASSYYSAKPNCSPSGLASVTKDLGSSSSKSYNYTIKDETNDELFSSSITLDARDCTTLELQ